MSQRLSKFESRQDIRQYSDRELSLIIFNTEHLYRAMHRPNFLAVIQDCFLYNDNQMVTLIADIEEDLEENENTQA